MPWLHDDRSIECDDSEAQINWAILSFWYLKGFIQGLSGNVEMFLLLVRLCFTRTRVQSVSLMTCPSNLTYCDILSILKDFDIIYNKFQLIWSCSWIHNLIIKYSILLYMVASIGKGYTLCLLGCSVRVNDTLFHLSIYYLIYPGTMQCLIKSIVHVTNYATYNVFLKYS